MKKFIALVFFAFVAFAIYVVDCSKKIDNENVSVALCYKYDPPIADLSHFDWVVLDSDAQFTPSNWSANSTVWLAYISVGEVASSRSYYNKIPKLWFIGTNDAWKATIINQTASGWPEFVVNTIAKPLWNRGFKGFFLDTLDSYQIVSKNDAQRREQEAGLILTIQHLKAALPNPILIFNRGFEIMAQAHTAANMVAFESLFYGWNEAQKRIVNVTKNDRNWLLARASEIKNYSLPVLSIDYYKPDSQSVAWAKTIARRIKNGGIIPYVTDPYLQTVGYGPPNMD